MPIKCILLPSQARLKELRKYDPDTGEWMDNRGNVKTRSNYQGYRKDNIEGTEFKVHRLIYKWMTGVDPGDDSIDHENGDPSDNRWINLRPSNPQHQAENTKRTKKDGYPGVIQGGPGYWRTSKPELGWYREQIQAAAALQQWHIDNSPGYVAYRHEDLSSFLVPPFIGPVATKRVQMRKPPAKKLHAQNALYRSSGDKFLAVFQLSPYRNESRAYDTEKAACYLGQVAATLFLPKYDPEQHPDYRPFYQQPHKSRGQAPFDPIVWIETIAADIEHYWNPTQIEFWQDAQRTLKNPLCDLI